MLSSFKSVEFVGKLLQGKREDLNADIFIPQKPEMPEQRLNPQPLESSVPEQEGVPSEYLSEFYKEMSQEDLAAHCIVVARHGKIIASGAYAPYRTDVWHITHSMCKSITSLAVGIAISEGYFSLEDSIYDIFPDSNKWPEALKRYTITVRELLTMSSGRAYNEMATMTESDWVEGFVNSIEMFPPGTNFAYNSTNSFMLSAIIQLKTGMKMMDYLNEKLLHPMGIYDLYWEESPKFINKGGWGLNIWIEDMVKLGILCMNQGRWNGQQLVPEAWIREATRKQINTPEEMNRYGYGYQFWMCERPGSYQFNGMLGQNVVVIPDRDIVVAMTSGSNCLFPEGKAMDIIMKYFGGDDAPFYDHPLEENVAAQKALTQVLSQLSFKKIIPPVRRCLQHSGSLKGKNVVLKRSFPFGGKTEQGIPNVLTPMLGHIYDASQNTASVIPLMVQMFHANYAVGIRELGLNIRDGVLCLETWEGEAHHMLRIGFNEPAYSTLEMNGEYYLVGTYGQIRTDEDGNPLLYLLSSFVETTSTNIIKIWIGDDRVMLKFDETPRVDEVVNTLDIMMPVKALRELMPVRKVSDLKFAKTEMKKVTRQRFWATKRG